MANDFHDSPPPYICDEKPAKSLPRRRLRCSILLHLFSILICFFLMCSMVSVLFVIVRNSFSQPFHLSSSFSKRHTTILISMDGFRHNYLEIVRRRFGKNALPNFHYLERFGVRAWLSINAFPTVTLPNHQTLITGLYPQHHGVIGNVVKDLKLPNATLKMSDQESLNRAPWLLNWPEPVWVTLQKSGKLVGSLLWPLTDGNVHGDLPFQQVSQFTLLDGASTNYSYSKRVSDVLWWLKNPYYHLDFIMLYFSEPDISGHQYGPDSLQVANRVVELDAMLGLLLDGIEKRELTKNVDIILTADHGMTTTSTDRIIPLDNYVHPSFYTYTAYSTVGFLYPIIGQDENVYQALKDRHPNLTVFRRPDAPAYLHFNVSHSRMPVLILLPDPGWTVAHSNSTPISVGNHGYAPNDTDMNPFFLAMGSAFQVGTVVPVVHAVDVYPLICGLTAIYERPNNGSLKRISNILKPAMVDRLLSFRWIVVHEDFLWSLGMLALLLTAFVSMIILSYSTR